MNISDLKAGQGKVDVEVTVKSMDAPRSFNKFGKELKVANAMVSDSSGEIKLSLWNDDVDKVKVGDKVKITNGYVSEFNGEKQLTSGKFGKLEVVGAGSTSHDSVESKETSHSKKSKKAPSEDEEDLDDVAF